MENKNKNKHLNFGLLFIVLSFLFIPGVFAEEPAQEDVDIVEFIDCPFYNMWCKFKKSTLKSAYEYQETNYNVIQESMTGADLIQVTEFDSFHKDMHKFGKQLLKIYYMLWGVVIVILLISSFASPIRQMIAEEHLKKFSISIALMTVAPIVIVLINNFFFQFIKLFLMDVNITNLILYPYTLDQGVMNFWFVSFLADKVLLLIGSYALLYKAILYLSPILILFVVALWYTPHRPELLKNFLIVSYAYYDNLSKCFWIYFISHLNGLHGSPYVIIYNIYDIYISKQLYHIKFTN